MLMVSPACCTPQTPSGRKTGGNVGGVRVEWGEKLRWGKEGRRGMQMGLARNWGFIANTDTDRQDRGVWCQVKDITESRAGDFSRYIQNYWSFYVLWKLISAKSEQMTWELSCCKLYVGKDGPLQMEHLYENITETVKVISVPHLHGFYHFLERVHVVKVNAFSPSTP